MTMERDPLLLELFHIANRKLPGDAFITSVMSRIDALRRRAILAWAAIGLVLAIAAWLLTPTVVGAVDLLSQTLPQSLLEIDEPAALIGQVQHGDRVVRTDDHEVDLVEPPVRQ